MVITQQALNDPATAEDHDPVPLEPPSREEIEVMQMILAGIPDAAVARRLGVSVVTVRRRSTRFRRRLGAVTRLQAVARAVQLGWLQP